MHPTEYEIIATLGPSSGTPLIWQSMLQTGVTGFRLNTSHLNLDELAAWLERLSSYFKELEITPPVVLDLQGSKWRLGQIEARELSVGQRVELVLGTESAQPGSLPVPHPDFFRAAPFSNGEIVLNDARVRLVIESQTTDHIRARTVQGGPLSAHKGITYAESGYRSESLSEKDQAIFALAREMPTFRYAISYVRDAAEMAHYRSLVEPISGRHTYLIAKLERGPAMHEAAAIAEHANELWICRGDLGAELGMQGMAAAVHQFSISLSAISIPVLMAGQVLEHMASQPTPTRSEVCYLYDTLALGYHGFVLSDEAAVGRYPVEACQAAAMFKI